jgi:4-hydroxybenzoate polyprenyltransferase
LKLHLTGTVRLTRYREYLWFVAVTTFLGVIAARGAVGWPLVGVLAANWLAVAFAFMINDVEDADDDALDPTKVKRNPVSAGDLSPRRAYAASLGVALLSACVYALVGGLPFIAGVTCLLLGFFYSWRPVRLKSMPLFDLASHCLMLAGLQFIAAYVTFTTELGPRFFWPLAFTMAVSLYGELYNELRDLPGDRAAGLKHTACLVGSGPAHWLMMTCLAVGIGAGLVCLFVIKLIPLPILGLVLALAAILLVRPILKFRRGRSLVASQAPFQKPFEIAGAVALAIHVVWPAASAVAQTRLFWLRF